MHLQFLVLFICFRCSGAIRVTRKATARLSSSSLVQEAGEAARGGGRAAAAADEEVVSGSLATVPALPKFTRRRKQVMLAAIASGFVSLLVLLSLWHHPHHHGDSAKKSASSPGVLSESMGTRAPLSSMPSSHHIPASGDETANTTMSLSCDQASSSHLPPWQSADARVQLSNSPLVSPRLQASAETANMTMSYDIPNISHTVQQQQADLPHRPGVMDGAEDHDTTAGGRGEIGEGCFSQPLHRSDQSIATIGGSVAQAGVLTAGTSGELRDKLLNVHRKHKDRYFFSVPEEVEDLTLVGKQ